MNLAKEVKYTRYSLLVTRYFFLRWLLLLLLVVLGFLFFKGRKFFQQQMPGFSSVVASSGDQKIALKKQIREVKSASAAPLKTAAPLDVLSEQELKDFPGGKVVEAVEIDGPEFGQKTRMRILKTHFKYPYIRTEEIIHASGNVLRRCEMVATHLLVRLSAEEDPEHFLNQLGPDVTSLERVTSKDTLYQLELNSHSVATLPRVFDEIKSKKFSILSKEPDCLTHALLTPNNPLYAQQWYLWKECSHVRGPLDYRRFFSGIDACEAWNQRTSAENIVVAVIDSGIRYTHEDLAANMWHEEDPIYGTIYGWNFSVAQDDPKKSDPMDDFGHGTACAGIIGGVGNSGVGTVGIAWKVQLMAVKYYDQPGVGTISDAVKAIDFACEHGAKILNCSWKSDNGASTALQEAIGRVRDQGGIVVAAAGNTGDDNDQSPLYPANYAHGYGLDNVISVAATTEDDQLASFSNFGATTVDIAAPGEEIFSTWARTDSDYLTATTRKEILPGFDEEQLNKAPCGTSLAAPQVVGALALLKAQFPTWTYQQLIQRLMDTSDPIPPFSEKKIIAGKLNVARALGAPISL